MPVKIPLQNVLQPKGGTEASDFSASWHNAARREKHSAASAASQFYSSKTIDNPGI